MVKLVIISANLRILAWMEILFYPLNLSSYMLLNHCNGTWKVTKIHLCKSVDL